LGIFIQWMPPFNSLPESLQCVFHAACILFFKWISGGPILKVWIYSWGNFCAQQTGWEPFTRLGDEQVMIFYNASSLAIELIHKSFSCIVILLTLNTGVQEFNREPYSTLQFNIWSFNFYILCVFWKYLFHATNWIGV
jgi:hypothetical protein